MKFELFLDKINQEMINTPLDRRRSLNMGCCIYASWTKSCCILDFSFSPLEEYIKEKTIPQHWMIRGEEEGGLMWNPKTGQVYKIDEEAYNAIIDLEHGYSIKHVADKLNLKGSEIVLLEQLVQKIIEVS